MLGRSLSKSVRAFALFSFFLFIALGNLFRLLDNSWFSDRLLISEIFVYGSSVLCLPFLSLGRKKIIQWLVLSFAVVCSFVYGCQIQGFSVSAGLYAARLIFLLLSLCVLKELCWKKFGGALEPFFLFLCRAYLCALFLGSILYVFFPASERLWTFLQSLHIGFQGDPHTGRFVSVYFDPNYYASIVGIPFLLSLYLQEVTRERKYAFYATLFFLSGVLTWSRSGIFVLVFLILYKGLIFLKQRRCSKQRWLGSGAAFFSLLIICFIYKESWVIFWDRIIHFFEDDSALCRLQTFRFGLELWQKTPFFGMGINFLFPYTKEGFGLNSLDSSLLALLVQIGSVPFIGLLFWAGIKSLKFFPLQRLWKQKQQQKSPYFFSSLCMYAIVIVFFASQFNNLLFYPFWLLPFGVIFLYVCSYTSTKIDTKKESTVKASFTMPSSPKTHTFL